MFRFFRPDTDNLLRRPFTSRFVAPHSTQQRDDRRGITISRCQPALESLRAERSRFTARNFRSASLRFPKRSHLPGRTRTPVPTEAHRLDGLRTAVANRPRRGKVCMPTMRVFCGEKQAGDRFRIRRFAISGCIPANAAREGSSKSQPALRSDPAAREKAGERAFFSAYSYLWLRRRYSVSADSNGRLLLHSTYSYLWLRRRYSVSADSSGRLLLHSTFRIFDFTEDTPARQCSNKFRIFAL